MNTFSKDFYQPKFNYTREMAENVMRENGYTNFHFTGMSHANGASFYFEADGKEVRISDHYLTGRRAFDTIQLPIVEVKKTGNIIKKQEGVSDLMKGIYAKALKLGHMTIEQYNEKMNG